MNKKHFILIAVTVMAILLLSGCSSGQTNTEAITSDSDGFFSHYFVYPLSYLITKVANFAGLGYGIAIIAVTLFVRTLMLPLMIKQTKSQKAMQAIQPELNKLKEKHSSKDQATRIKLQQETAALFKENGINPLAGCLPLLVQMPILIAFYQAISRTEAIATQDFLWVNLGTPDTLYILPVLAGLTTFLQQKVAMIGQDTSSAAAQQMKIMLYIMPLMILFFSLNFASALSLYWTVGNIYGIIQTYLIKAPDMKGGKQNLSKE